MRWLVSTLLALAGCLYAFTGAASAAPPATTGAGEVRFSQDGWTVDESAGMATISVERTSLPVTALQVDYATRAGTATPGSDYHDAAGTLDLPVGTSTASFWVPVVDDAEAEGPETVVLRIVAVRSAGGSGTAGPEAVLTIRDDVRRRVAPLAGPSSNPAPSAGTERSVAAGPAPTAVETPVRRRAATTAAATAGSSVVRFELRTRSGPDGTLSVVDPATETTRVSPLLALLAGLLVARLWAEVWFRVRLVTHNGRFEISVVEIDH